jgi:hypothetical protein
LTGTIKNKSTTIGLESLVANIAIEEKKRLFEEEKLMKQRILDKPKVK